jgi:excisionase family DNA binding protein
VHAGTTPLWLHQIPALLPPYRGLYGLFKSIIRGNDYTTFVNEKMQRMDNSAVPILIPLAPADFWAQIRIIIQEELSKTQKTPMDTSLMETPGLTQKPLYKISEICTLFQVSRPTVYEWVKHGKLRRVKIRSRVYFLGTDIRDLLK